MAAFLLIRVRRAHHVGRQGDRNAHRDEFNALRRQYAGVLTGYINLRRQAVADGQSAAMNAQAETLLLPAGMAMVETDGTAWWTPFPTPFCRASPWAWAPTPRNCRESFARWTSRPTSFDASWMNLTR